MPKSITIDNGWLTVDVGWDSIQEQKVDMAPPKADEMLDHWEAFASVVVAAVVEDLVVVLVEDLVMVLLVEDLEVVVESLEVVVEALMVVLVEGLVVVLVEGFVVVLVGFRLTFAPAVIVIVIVTTVGEGG